jgi:nucleoside-diphosphate-sugar epimerase
MSTVTVIAARKGVGLECVRRLVEKQVSEVKEIRAVVRSAKGIPSDLFPSDDRVKVVEGDVTNEVSLRAAMFEADYAIFAASGSWGKVQNLEVDERGMLKTISAAEACGVKRVVFCSSQLVDPVNGWHPARIILQVMTKGIMDSKFRGENHVKKFCETSKVEYTIVRPGGLIDGPLGATGLACGQTDCAFLGVGSHTRADVARVIVEAMKSPKTLNCTFEMAGIHGVSSPVEIEPLFADLKGDVTRSAEAAVGTSRKSSSGGRGWFSWGTATSISGAAATSSSTSA